MNGLVFASGFDSGGKHPHDASGAFIPCAKAFAKHYDLPLPYLYDNRPTSMPARFNQILDYISRTVGKLDVVAGFSHGWRTGTQWGLTLGNVQELARALAPYAAETLTIGFVAACSAGEDPSEAGHTGVHDDAPGAGEGSIADELRDALFGLGVKAKIVAHASVGHVARNPFVRVFEPGAVAGGEWLIGPHERVWGRWVHAMQTTDLWIRMPFMTHDEIVAELMKP